MSSDPSKISGNIKDAVGKAQETIGDLTGLQSLKNSGQQRQAEGNVEYKQAQAEGYVEGTKDRVLGTVDKAKGVVTGDSSQEAAGDVRKEGGKIQQGVNSS